MTNRSLVARGLVAGAGLFTVAAGAGAQTERVTLRGDRVAIYDLVGSVRLQPGSGSDVTVEITRRGPDASRLRVESGALRGRETLRVIFPATRVLYRQGRSGWSGSNWRTTLQVDDDGTFGDGGDRRVGRRVEIASRGDGLDAQADLVVSVPRGKELALYLAAGDAEARNVDGDLVIDVSMASVTTTGTRGRLLVDAGSGEVSITDANGEVTLDAGSGGVSLAGVRGPRLDIDAGSGNIRGSDLAVEELRLDAGSGGVRLSRVSAPEIDIDAGSGSVDVSLAADVRSMRVDSGSGGITIGIPESLGAEVTAELGSGGLDLDIPFQMTRRTRDHLAGRIGDGRGRIVIDSGSGTVRLRRP